MRDYYSPYYDPMGAYQSEIDRLNEFKQQNPELGAQVGQLTGNLAGMYAGGQIPGVLSSTLPSSVGPVAAQGGLGIGSLGAAPILGIAGGLALGAKGVKDLLQNNKTKGLEGWGGRATLGIATGGLSELARAFGIGGHESTRDTAKRHTKGLLSQAPDNAKWQNYVSAMREQYNNAPPDPSKPFAGGKYGSFDEYKKAGLQADDLTGVYGNLNTYGTKWSDLDFNQQKALTQKNIDAGNYSSKKGEVNITDKAKALSFLDELLASQKK